MLQEMSGCLCKWQNPSASIQSRLHHIMPRYVTHADFPYLTISMLRTRYLVKKYRLFPLLTNAGFKNV